jgi:tellurite resistance protein
MRKRDKSMVGVDEENSAAVAAQQDHVFVERDREELREFVSRLSADDISSGGWFTKLLAYSLRTYTEKVDWRYFQDRYRGLPPDAIVEQRIKMAARYAAIEGGLSASAYTGAVVATIGTLGGASPATVPAAAATLMLDLAYTTRLQLHLAYDISVLYRVPLHTTNPDDLWKLIRVAFTIKSGEMVSEGLLKTVPAMMRPLIKRFYSKEVLKAAKGLPFVGKYLLQRNAIKVGIPLIGVPLAVVLNRQTTLIAGRHARQVFRNEAHTIEVAKNLVKQTKHPECLLWVAWLVTMADQKTSEDEANLLRYLVRFLEEHHQVVDEDLAHLITLDPDEVWRRLAAEDGDKSDLVLAAQKIAEIDGRTSAPEQTVITEIKRHCEPG